MPERFDRPDDSEETTEEGLEDLREEFREKYGDNEPLEEPTIVDGEGDKTTFEHAESVESEAEPKEEDNEDQSSDIRQATDEFDAGVEKPDYADSNSKDSERNEGEAGESSESLEDLRKELLEKYEENEGTADPQEGKADEDPAPENGESSDSAKPKEESEDQQESSRGEGADSGETPETSESLDRRGTSEESDDGNLEDIRGEFLEKHEGDEGSSEPAKEANVDDSSSQESGEPAEPDSKQMETDADQQEGGDSVEAAEAPTKSNSEAELNEDETTDPAKGLKKYRETVLQKYNQGSESEVAEQEPRPNEVGQGSELVEIEEAKGADGPSEAAPAADVEDVPDNAKQEVEAQQVTGKSADSDAEVDQDVVSDELLEKYREHVLAENGPRGLDEDTLEGQLYRIALEERAAHTDIASEAEPQTKMEGADGPVMEDDSRCREATAGELEKSRETPAEPVADSSHDPLGQRPSDNGLEDEKTSSEIWVVNPDADSVSVALGPGPDFKRDSEGRGPETPGFRLPSLDADSAADPLERLALPEATEARAVRTQLEAASDISSVEKEPDSRMFEAIDYGGGVVVRIPKTDLEERGFDTQNEARNRIAELVLRDGEGSLDTVFVRYSESDRRAVAYVNGIGGEVGDRYSLVDARSFDIDRFTELFDKGRCEHLQNVTIEHEEEKVFVAVDARKVELEDWRLSTSRNQVVLGGKLGGEDEFKISYDGRKETMRLGHDVVQGIRVEEDALVISYSQSKNEKHDHRLYLEHAEAPERPSVGHFAKPQVLEHVHAFEHPNIIEGEYRFAIDGELTNEIQSILSNEAAWGEKHVDRMKAEISERLVPNMLEFTGWERVKHHPFNETRKESASANGVDWLVRTPDEKLALLEVKWWGNATRAESKGSLQVTRAFKARREFEGEEIVGAYVAVMSWDANAKSIRVYVKRVRPEVGLS